MRRSAAWVAATAVLAGVFLTVSFGVPAAPVARAAGPCVTGDVCVLAADLKSPAEGWESIGADLAVGLAETSAKDRQFTLVLAPADGASGRLPSSYPIDKAEIVGTGTVAVTVPAGQPGRTFNFKITADTLVEPDEWLDIHVLEDGKDDRGHFLVRVADDDVSAKAVTADVVPGKEVVEGGSSVTVTISYPGTQLGGVADVTLIPVESPDSTRRFEVTPPVVRLAKGDSVAVEVRALPDASTQGATKIHLDVLAVPAEKEVGPPVALSPTVAGIARPVTNRSNDIGAVDAPPPQPRVSIADATVDEHDAVVRLTITRTTNLTGSLNIPVTYLDGTARLGFDYPHPNDDIQTGINIPAGAATATLTISLAPDSAYEGDETFQVRLGPLAGVTFTDNTALVTITDIADTPPVELVVGDLLPGHPAHVGVGGGSLPFHLTLPQAPAIPLTFDVDTSDIEAEDGIEEPGELGVEREDYVAFHAQVVIPAGQTVSVTNHLTVNPVAGPGLGGIRRFGVNVDGVSQAGETIGIFDPQEPFARFQRQAGDPPNEPLRRTLNEGDTGPITFPLVVTKPDWVGAGPYAVTATLHELVGTDSARFAIDVSISPTEFTLSPTETSRTITVTVAGNTVDEPDLPFAVVIAADRLDQIEPDDIAEFVVRDNDDPPDPTDGAADEVRNGVLDWFDGLASWHPVFDLGSFDWPSVEWPDVEFPVLPDLSPYFDLEDLFDGVAAPTFDVDADALDEAVADFAAVGCPVDFVVGGFGGAPEPTELGDVIQVHCTRTLDEIARASGYTGPDVALTSDVLADLAADLGLDATIDWTAEAEFHVIAGVDAAGFYLLGATGARLHVVGSGVVSGAGTVAGVQDAQLLGTGAADVTIVVPLDADATRRVRTDELAGLVPDRLRPSIAGAAELTLAAGVENTDVDWDGSWAITPDPTDGHPVIVTDHTVVLTQALPGFAVGAAAAPAVVTLTGEYGTCGGSAGWAVSGSFAPEQGEAFTFDGFAVSAVTATGCANTAGLTLDVEAALTFGEGPDAVDVGLLLHLAPGGAWSGGADVDVAELVVGPVVLTDAELTLLVAGSGDSVGVTVTFGAGSATFGESTLTGVSGSIHGSEQLALHAELMQAVVGGGALVFDLPEVDLTVPGVAGVVLSIGGSATATAPDIGGGLTVTVTGLTIFDDGRFSAASVAVVQPAGIAESIGLGGLIPVDLTGLQLVFTDVDPDTGAVDDLSEFEVHLAGTVDMTALANPLFTPVVQLGADVITPTSPPELRNVTFSALVEIAPEGGLIVSPLDLGPIALGLHDLTIGPFTFDVDVRADGYVDGVLQPGLDAAVAMTAGAWDDLVPLPAVTLDDLTFGDGPHGPEVDLTAIVGFSAASDDGLEIEDLQVALDVHLGFDADGAPDFAFGVDSVSLGSLTLPFGDFAELTLGAVTLDVSGSGADAAFTIGGALDVPGSGAELRFLDGSPLAGWSGRVGGLAIGADLVPRLTDGFFVDLTIPDGETFGLPDFLPIRVDGAGFALPDGIDAGAPLTELLGNLVITVSGGIDDPTGAFPVEADFDDLSVDLGKLFEYDPLGCGFDPACFPVDLAGFRLAVDPPVDLGGGSVSGELTFGRVPVPSVCGNDTAGDVLYGRIAGQLVTPAFQAGADVVVSEYGPVLIRVTAPAGVPLGPTGLVLQSVTGAAAFGDVEIPRPDPGQPEQLLDPGALADLATDADIDAAEIADRIAPSVDACQPTWDDGFAIALAGDLTHVAAAGMLGGRVTVGVNVRPDAGPQLFGLGEIEAFGVPLGDALPPEFELGDYEVGGSVALAGLLIDLADPLEPTVDLAFQSPAPGSPFELLVPTQVTVAAQLHTDGVLPGVIAGVEAGVASLSASARAAVLARTGGSTAVDDVIAAVAAYAATLTPAQAAALVEQFFGAVADAGQAALLAAGPLFNPSFVFRGALQPTVLGIPLGDPVNEVEIIMTRGSLGIGGTTSVVENMKRGLDLSTGGLAGPAITAVSLGLTDRLEFSVQLPVPDMTAVLFGDGDLQPFGTADPSWSGTLSGQISQLGMSAEVTGFITSAGNTGFVDARVEKRWECSDGTTPVPQHCTVPPDADRVQFSRELDYDRLIEHGGIVIDGRLEIPRLITDPADVLADATTGFPTDPVAMLGWFDEFGDTLGQTETPLRATFFVPGPGDLVDGSQTLEQWAAGISMTGVFEGTRQTPTSPPVARLLSLPIGEGRMLATTQGLEITADVPLLGVQGTFAARVDEVPFNGGTVTVPVGKLEVAMSSAALDAALDDLGLPPVFSATGVTAGVGFRGYTPGFDRTSPDALRRNGGMAFVANLDAAGFVDDARTEVVVTGADFRATASVAQLGPFGGVSVTDALLTVTKTGTAVAVHVEGQADVLGAHWEVVGDLNPDLTGSLVLTGSGDELPSLAGFEFVSGGLAINLSRTSGGALVGSVGIAGQIGLPSWLAPRQPGGGAGTVAAAGCVATNGNAELRLNLGTINLDPTGSVALTGTGAALPALPAPACTLPTIPGMTNNDARFVVRRAGGVTTLAVDGAVRISGSATPLLAVTGVLQSNGTGALTLRFGTSGTGVGGCTGTGGASVGGFTVKGCAALTLLPGGAFDLDVNGQIVVPGIGDLAVDGALEADGDFDLGISTAGGLRLGGPTSPFFATGAFRLKGVDEVYTFRATNAGFEYRQSNNTVLFSAVIPTFTISSNGAFSVRTNAFTLGPANGVHLNVPATELCANAAGAALKLRIPAPPPGTLTCSQASTGTPGTGNLPAVTLFVPDLADGTTGKPLIALASAFSIDTTNFRYVLFDATGGNTIDLGLMKLTGKLVFERVSGGPFQLAVEGINASTPARVDLGAASGGGLGTVDFPNFRFATNGDFDVQATTTALGPTSPRFRIADASVRLRNTGNATATTADDFVELAITGGDLQLPSLEPVALPDLSLRIASSFTRTISVPAIDLGPVFRTNGGATFQLTVERTRVRVELVTSGTIQSTCGGTTRTVANGPTLTALAGSTAMRLHTLLIDSDGAFSGSASGCLQVFGNELANGTFNIRLTNGLLELALPSPGLNVDWGFGSVRVTGFARSDGTFAFTGSMTTQGNVFGVVSWNGSASITADNSSLRGSFNGDVSVAGLSGGASGSVDSTGRVTGQLRVDLDLDGDTNGVPGFCTPATLFTPAFCTPTVPERANFDFRIGGTISPDTTAPTMSQPANVSVTTSSLSSSIPVYYAHPVASDNRDGSINATCNPGSGSQFAVGATRTVTCTARDGAGNSVSRSFTVTVTRALANISLIQDVIVVTVGGFAPLSTNIAALHSEPVALQETTTDADGRAHYEFTIPADAPPGEHHVVATGTGPDGDPRMWVVPIELGAQGEVLSIEDGTAVPDGAARFVPVAPVRLFDTRPAESAPGPKGVVGPEASIDVQVTGTPAGVPAEAVAVVMNVTVTDTTGPGYVTVFPTGTTRPLASSINLAGAGQTRPNLVTVPIGDGGRVTLFAKGAAHLLADVAGYYLPADAAVADGRFVPLTPRRLFDTRTAGAPVGARESIDVPVLGQGLVPATGIAAVVLNLTATEAASAGYVTAYPTGQARPLASTVNLSASGDTAPNLAIVPIGAGGSITVYASHGAHVLGDVAGYITDSTAAADTAGLFVPLAPERVFDTRPDQTAPGPKGFVPAEGRIDVQVAGVGSVPADAAGVVLNVTGIASPGGYLTAWETGPDRPTASTLNFAPPSDTRANAAMLPVGSGGQVSFFAKLGAHVLADVSGYFLR